MSKFTKHNNYLYDFGNSITDYFNEQLFQGKYINKETEKEVVFGENRQLTGIKDFSSYEVRNYFGTLHMH